MVRRVSKAVVLFRPELQGGEDFTGRSQFLFPGFVKTMALTEFDPPPLKKDDPPP
jgi:hypothetical protein